MGVLALPTAFAGPTASYDQDIYRITFTPAGATTGVAEWAALSTGTWRADLDNQTFVSSDEDYVVIDNDSQSVYHRMGSAVFMGDLHAAPDGVLAVRTYFQGDSTLHDRGVSLKVSTDGAGHSKLDAFDDATGKLVFTVTVDQHVTDQEAADGHLLDVTPSMPHTTDNQIAIGASPRLDLTAYWFGRTVKTWYAAAAAEHTRVRTSAQVMAGMSTRGEAQVYMTFYEQSGVQATSAQPGLTERPDGELQVSSEPIASAHAQGLLDAIDGKNGEENYPPWQRSTVKLEDGETVVVVPSQFDGDGPTRSGFFVITADTLVSVAGEVASTDIPGLAALLKPI